MSESINRSIDQSINFSNNALFQEPMLKRGMRVTFHIWILGYVALKCCYRLARAWKTSQSFHATFEANWINEELAFLESAIKIESRTSRRCRLQMQSASNNRKRNWIWVAFYYHFFPKKIADPRPDRSCWFLQGSFILSFSLKDVSHSAPPNCLLSNPLHSRRFHCTTIQHYFCCWSPHSELLFCWVIF